MNYIFNHQAGRYAKKWSMIVLFSLFVVLALSPASHAKIILKCGTSTQPTHIYNLAAEDY